jgi:hypothetical protein
MSKLHTQLADLGFELISPDLSPLVYESPGSRYGERVMVSHDLSDDGISVMLEGGEDAPAFVAHFSHYNDVIGDLIATLTR